MNNTSSDRISEKSLENKAQASNSFKKEKFAASDLITNSISAVDQKFTLT
jgi:hypothetical protein